METIKERAEMQLRAIEMAYSIDIQNKEDIAQLIATSVKDKRQVLTVCTSLNSWIASNNISGGGMVPLNVVSKFIDAIKWYCHPYNEFNSIENLPLKGSLEDLSRPPPLVHHNISFE